jgi:hypothetical protein
MNDRNDSAGTDPSAERPSEDVPAAVPANPHRNSMDLFPPPVEPRFFGMGNYDSGGTHTGNYALGEINRRGGYGAFTDAGGPGSTLLLGNEPAEEELATQDTCKGD